jgi:hypothetical protein
MMLWFGFWPKWQIVFLPAFVGSQHLPLEWRIRRAKPTRRRLLGYGLVRLENMLCG